MELNENTLEVIDIIVGGEAQPHHIVPMPADGSCLFHAISYAINKMYPPNVIRGVVVEYVVRNWDELQLYTCNAQGSVYPNSDEYAMAMANYSTYGSISELMAAAALFPFKFEVYERGILRGCFENIIDVPIKRLRFSGSYLGGHYDILQPINLSEPLQSDRFLEMDAQADSEKFAKKGGRPKKIKRGRPEKSNQQRSKQLKKAAARNRKNKLKSFQDSQTPNTSQHPPVRCKAVTQQTERITLTQTTQTEDDILPPTNLSEPLLSDRSLEMDTQDCSKKTGQKVGRPKKIKIGRPKKPNKQRSKQLKKAAARNRKNKLESFQDSQTPNTSQHPPVRCKAVTQQTERITLTQTTQTEDDILPPTNLSEPLLSDRSLEMDAQDCSKKTGQKVGRPKKLKIGRPKKPNKQRSEQLKKAGVLYRQNNPEKFREIQTRYVSQHPLVHRQAVTQYSAKNPEVNKQAVARYSASHPEINRQASIRKKSTNKLRLKFKNTEQITRVLTTKTGDRLEAEKLLKWALHNRQDTLKNLTKTVEKLKQKLTTSLEKLSACSEKSSIVDKFGALLGKLEHRDNQEPFYFDQTYKIRQNRHDAIAIDDLGKAVFSKVEKKGKGLVWNCSEILCGLNENVLTKIVRVCEELKDRTIYQFYTLSVESNVLHSMITSIYNVKSHSPQLRTIIREMYQVHSDSNAIKKIDDALNAGDIEEIRDLGVHCITESVDVLCNELPLLVEDDIIEKYKNAFNAYTTKCSDTPKYDCLSCNKLCFLRDVCDVRRLRKPINTIHWSQLLEYYSTINDTPSNYICHSCLNKFRSNQLPPCCILNDLYNYAAPKQITDLNDYEKILIQRAKAFQVVVSMKPVSNKQLRSNQMVKKVKGRTFHLQLPLVQTLKKLPKPEDALNKNAELYIIVRGMPTKSKIIWEDVVDIKKVYDALKYLKEVNIHYSNIHLPNSPQQLLTNMNQDIHHTISTHEKTDEDEESGALLTQVSTSKEIDYGQYTIYPLHELKQNATICELYQMIKVNAAPINNSDKNIDTKCFPDLFIEGKFGQFHPRRAKLTSSEFIKCKLMSKCIQFRLNQQYLFYLLNDANMRELSAGIFYKMNCVNQKEKLTVERYFEMLSKDELEGDITAIFGRLRNTEQFWKKPRNDVNCMVQHYGPATWFLTLSPSEWMWDDLGEYIREANSPLSLSNKSVSELVALDPVSTSRFMDNKFRAMLTFITSNDGPLGKVEHYFWRREYQSRGAQHFHLLLWVKDAPILNESPIEEVASFIAKHVTCELPQKNVSPTLYQRVNCYQTHRHNSYCMRKKKTKKGYVSICRFGFPRPVTDHITIRDVVESIAAKKTLNSNKRLYNIVRKKEWAMINDYNPALLLAWNGNIDLQYVGEKTAVLNYYVTKYTTKSEKTHAVDMFTDINSTKTLRGQLYNIGLRVLSHRECGAFEASDTLLGIPLCGTDPNTTIRWLDVNMFRNRRVKSRIDMTKLDPHSTDIYYESWIDNHYPTRPKELENTSLYEFTRNYDIVKTEPKRCTEYYNIGGGKFLKRRERPYLINHYIYDVEQMPEKFFYSLLLLFKPWRSVEHLKMGFETYTEAFNSVKDQLKDGLIYAEKKTKMLKNLDKVFEMVEEKLAELNEERENEDAGPDNPLNFEAHEALNAMEDFQNINKNQVDDTENFSDLENMIENLNCDQKRVFDMVTSKLMKSSLQPSNDVLRCFISGTGGTGKSYLIKTIKTWVQYHLKKQVAITAPTGIAAFNVNGLTIHRLLQLPVEHKQTPKYRPLSDEVLKVLRADLKDVALFIIDEVSMISNVTLTYIHLRLCEIFNTSDEENGWFGKKHILLLGDLLQLPPVRENSPFVKLTPSEVNKLLGSLSVPNLWTELFNYDELTVNMRQLNDTIFVYLLNRIRVGVITQQDREVLAKRLITLRAKNNEGRLLEISQFLCNLPDDTVCLLPTRNMCQQLNKIMLDTISGPEIKLKATDSIDCPKYLQKRARECLKKYDEDASMTAGLEETIIIKEGSRVMLRRNIDVSLGLVNGSIGTVVKVKHDSNAANIKSVVIKFKNIVHELLAVKSKFEILNRAFVYRQQYPISVAYAITIHKSQGLSLTSALLDIGTSVFSCGQAYVALSRVTSLSGVHLINLDFSCIKAQESSISEYNRLRATYRPELNKMTYFKPPKRKNQDREWTLRKNIADVQRNEDEPPKKKRNIRKKNLKK